MDILNSSFQTQTDSAIRDMDNVSIDINYSLRTKKILDSSFQLNSSKELSNELIDLFVSMNGVDWKTDQINFYDFAGQVLRVGLITKTEAADFTQSELYDAVNELSGSKLITRPTNLIDIPSPPFRNTMNGIFLCTESFAPHLVMM